MKDTFFSGFNFYSLWSDCSESNPQPTSLRENQNLSERRTHSIVPTTLNLSDQLGGSPGGHPAFRDSTQEVAAAEGRDVLGELVRVEHHPVVPHDHSVGGVPQDDDLQLEDGAVGGEGDAVVSRKRHGGGEVEEKKRRGMKMRS